MMKSTSGRAVWLKHEARKLLKKLFEGGGPSGSFDDINQVAEHAYYRNSPANENSKFSIENPHLTALWLVHLEELVPYLQPKPGKDGNDEDDSVAGLARFFIAHFPAVTNKLLPAGTVPEEADKLIESEGYFNKLTFDQLATADVNILLVLSRLFVQYVTRADEVQRPERYSKLLGLHSLTFDSEAWKEYVDDFNKCTDRVIAAQRKVKTRVDAGKLSKDKTNLLQFVPNVDQLEKAIRFLLPSELTQPQINVLTPEELVLHLTNAKIDDIVNTFRSDMISAEASRRSVRVGKAPAGFYAQQYKLHEDIATKLQEFQLQRQALRMMPTPRPCTVFNELIQSEIILPGKVGDRYLQLLGSDFTWSEYVKDPGVSDTAVLQARYELCALGIAGLVQLSGLDVHVLRFPVNDATLSRRLATLHLLDPTVDLQLLSDSVLRGAGAEAAPWAADHDQALATLLKRAQREGVPEVDIQSCPDMFGEISIASQLATEARQADNSPRAKVHVNADMSAESIQSHVGPVVQILKACLLSVRTEIPGHEVGKKFGGIIDEPNRLSSVSIAFKLWEVLGLGRTGARGGTLTLLRPFQSGDISRAARRLGDLFDLDVAKVETKLAGRSPNTHYQQQISEQWIQFIEPIIQNHLETLSQESRAADASAAEAAGPAGPGVRAG